MPKQFLRFNFTPKNKKKKILPFHCGLGMRDNLYYPLNSFVVVDVVQRFVYCLEAIIVDKQSGFVPFHNSHELGLGLLISRVVCYTAGVRALVLQIRPHHRQTLRKLFKTTEDEYQLQPWAAASSFQKEETHPTKRNAFLAPAKSLPMILQHFWHLGPSSSRIPITIQVSSYNL